MIINLLVSKKKKKTNFIDKMKQKNTELLDIPIYFHGGRKKNTDSVKKKKVIAIHYPLSKTKLIKTITYFLHK